MNPDTNKLEPLTLAQEIEKRADAEVEDLGEHLRAMSNPGAGGGVRLLRPDGSPVPEHWSVFTVGEHVVVKDHTFKVAYMNEGSILLEPVGPVLVGEPAAG